MRKWKAFEVKKALLSTTGVIIALPLVILLNMVFSFTNLRWDTTSDKIYSISDGSRRILAGLTDPVTVKFYWSRSSSDFPQQMRLYAGQVADFLTELQRASDGRFSFEQIDPKPDSDAEEMAQRFGLEASQTQEGTSLYFGLVFLSAASCRGYSFR